ncbi:ABC transporter permease [Spirosoma validum]|uniref:ABC transporter permease n=1 Tax=Spirosoma validum TaxID=2771355 RepID=A0A927GGY3_9BACT|nr:FtsX-like permease family protein [Spirosoma validum]MBD2757361.1 ABC transporter permease [Spirosoma validum]
MIHNYVKIAWRNLVKYKLFSLINIIGLSLAIPTALLGLIQIVNYYEYDDFHPDQARIVRLITDEKLTDGSITSWASSPLPLATYVKENLAGIEKATTLVRELDFTLSNGLKTKNSKAIYTDTFFFQLFNFPLETGSYPTEPNTIVLTHETARWFFNDVNPIGNTLEHPKLGSFKIVGILKPFNAQKTQFRTDVFIPIASHRASMYQPNDWADLKAHTFLKLANGMTLANLTQQLVKTSSTINDLLPPSVGKKLYFKGQYLADISPANEILLNDPYIQDIRSIAINFAFQLIILLLASLNYINLTLARSMNRSREVGVRKVAGATKAQLVFQFLIESVLVSYIALSVGLLILWLVKHYLPVSWLTWDIDHLGYLILLFLILNLLLGLVAGATPSLILSSFQPVKVLKGRIAPASFGKLGFRKSLIVVQFAIALIYLFFMGHSYHQIKYMANDNENYQRHHILTINLPAPTYQPFANDINALKEVKKVGYSSLTFGNKPPQSTIKPLKSETAHLAFYYAADPVFIDNMGLRFVAGTNLVPSHGGQASPLIVVNQKAVDKLGLGSPQEAIGKLVTLHDTLSATIIGVVANFCHYDYERKIEPVVFQYAPSLFKVLCLQTNPVSDRKLVEASLQSLWHKRNPGQEMAFSWLDEDMYERYFPRHDMQLMGLEGLVIFVIAILGLIGILTYSVEKRAKEIGIRKVIGATTGEIIKLMSREFIHLLTLATIIALPSGIAIGMYMNTYFVFNNGLSYGIMGLLWLLVVGVALGAVGYFSSAAAQANPTTTLKLE